MILLIWYAAILCCCHDAAIGTKQRGADTYKLFKSSESGPSPSTTGITFCFPVGLDLTLHTPSVVGGIKISTNNLEMKGLGSF